MLFFYVIFLNKQKNDVEINYKKELRKTEKTIDSLYVVNKKLDKEISLIDKQLKNIDKKVIKKEKKINKIKQKTDEKIIYIDSYNVNQLSDFFTNRYKKTSDTTGFSSNN
jgi:peptidoglycan hydrolase CwlO-like protein